MLSRQCGHLTALLACGVARWIDDQLIELTLNGDEAAEGGMVTISMRVPVYCTACTAAAATACPRCGGKRTFEESFAAWLAVPPEVAEGTVLHPSAMLPGMVQPVAFRVRVRRAPVSAP